MSDILFIANDPRVLELIENLQPLIGPRFGVEAEFSSGIRRIFDEHPAIVFLQSTIDEVSCEKPANQVKMLFDKETIRLVLLSGDADSSYSLSSAFDCCFDINLPLEELSRQVRQHFPSLCQSAFQEAVTEENSPSQLTDSSFGEFPAAIEGMWSSSEHDFPDVVLTLEELESNSAPDTRLQESQPGFYRIQKEYPYQLFDALADAPIDPPSFFPTTEPKKLPGKEPSEPATIEESTSAESDDKGFSSNTSHRQAVHRAMAAPRKASPKLDDLPDAVAAEIGIDMRGTRSYRGLVICALLVLCLASVGLFIKWHYGATSPVSSKPIAKHAPVPAPQSSTMQQLPLFVPLTAPDASYAASHPGWERYHADAVEYLVYREKGRIRAIQVLSEQHGAITLPFMKTCIRVAGGSELSATKTEARGDYKVVTGVLQNGVEVATYQKSSDGEIRGFVLSFPVDRQAAPGVAKGAAR